MNCSNCSQDAQLQCFDERKLQTVLVIKYIDCKLIENEDMHSH